MSRIGKSPIGIPEGIVVSVTDKTVVIKGEKGEIKRWIPDGIRVVVHRNEIEVKMEKTNGKNKRFESLHGSIRAHIANDVIGVIRGWVKMLELSGVGYRADMAETKLILSLGFSHKITIVPPDGITLQLVDGKIQIHGIDRQLVGQVAANIRALKPPEPYKGKGIRYVGEYVRKKAGKAAKAISAGVTAGK